MKQRLARLERITGEMNQWLALCAIGLCALYIVAFLSLRLPFIGNAVSEASANEAGLDLPIGDPGFVPLGS